MKIWIKVMVCVVTISSLYGASEQWNGKSDHPVKIFETNAACIPIETPVDTTDTLPSLDRSTKKTCVVAGVIALVICYKLIPLMESMIRNNGIEGE